MDSMDSSMSEDPLLAELELRPLVHINEPPSEAQERVLIKRITDLTSELDALEAIVQLKRNQIQGLKRLLSPIRQVPPELISQVLWFALADDVEDEYDNGMDTDERAKLINFCLVSKKWREAALLNHRLWTSLYVDIQKRPLIELYPLIKQWFDRAGNFPKHLEIDILHPLTSSNRGVEHDECVCVASCLAGSRRLAQLIVHEGPWRSIRLQLYSARCFKRLTNAIRGLKVEDKSAWKNLPALSLNIREDWFEAKTNLEDLPFVSRLSMLSDPPVKAMPDGFSLLPVAVASSTITHLDVHCVWGETGVLTILSSCRNLRSCTLIVDSHCPHAFGAFVVPTPLPNLKSLTVRGVGIQHQGILAGISAPSLETLALIFDPGLVRPEKVERQLMQFVQTLKAEGALYTLRVESLYGTAVAQPVMTFLLDELASIRHLILNRVDIAADIFLDSGGMHTRLLNLEMVELMEMPPTFSGRKFWNFVDVRQRALFEMSKGGVAIYYDELPEKYRPKASIKLASLRYRDVHDFCQPGTKVFN